MSQKQPQCIHGAFESLEIFMSSSLQSCSTPCGYRCIVWGSSILSVDVFGSINNAWGRLYDFFNISGLPEPTLPPTSPITPINPELVRIVAPPKPWINPYAPKAPSRLRKRAPARRYPGRNPRGAHDPAPHLSRGIVS